MEKKDPIIIIGAGRTGSTAFHHMLSKHPALARLPGEICNLSSRGQLVESSVIPRAERAAHLYRPHIELLWIRGK